MSQKLSIIWAYLAHYKYFIVIVAGVLIVGVVDDNSIRQHIKYQLQIATLREEIGKYQAQYEKDSRYVMKADDEDIFVLSTDLPEEAGTAGNSEDAVKEGNSENAE